MAIATPLQHNINNPRFVAIERIKFAGGHGISAGASAFNPIHVPIIIAINNPAVHSITIRIVRVMIQCRARGRDKTRSMNPVSISDVGVVARAIDIAISEPITDKWK
jgi:hypothetical protein